MNKLKVDLKACELACINLNTVSFVYEYLSRSQGKFASKSQGFLSERIIAGNPHRF